MKVYKEEKEWDAQPKDDDMVNDENAYMGYESENCGEPCENHEDEIHISKSKLELVLRKNVEENTVWDFSFVKTWCNQEKNVCPMYCPRVKVHKPWLEKEDLLCIIEEDLGEIGL